MKRLTLLAALTLSTAVLGSVALASTSAPPAYRLGTTSQYQDTTALVTPFGLLLTLVVALVLFALVMGCKVAARANKRQLRRPVAVTLLALGGVALAQVLPSAGSGGINFGILTPFAPWLITLGGAGVLAALALGNGLMKGKIDGVKNAALRHALDLVTSFVYTAVTSLAQTATDVLKEGAADGKLTPEEAKAALKKAVDTVWLSLPAATRTLLSGLYGGEDAVKQNVIAPQVEQAIHNGATRTLSPLSLSGAARPLHYGEASNATFNQDSVTGILNARAAAGQKVSAEVLNAARARLGLPPKANPAAN